MKQPLENLGNKFKHVHNRGELQGALNDEGSRQAKQGPETYWAPATKSKTCGAAHARNKYVNPGDARFYVEWGLDQYWLASLTRHLVSFFHVFVVFVASVLKVWFSGFVTFAHEAHAHDSVQAIEAQVSISISIFMNYCFRVFSNFIILDGANCWCSDPPTLFRVSCVFFDFRSRSGKIVLIIKAKT